MTFPPGEHREAVEAKTVAIELRDTRGLVLVLEGRRKQYD